MCQANVAGNTLSHRTFIRFIAIADAPATRLIVIVIDHARQHCRISREYLSFSHDGEMNHSKGRQSHEGSLCQLSNLLITNVAKMISR